MKKLVVLVSLCWSVVCLAQTKSKKPAPVKKPAATTPAMKNALDSFSYAMGLSIANFYKEQGVTSCNTNLVVQGIADAQSDKPKLDEAAVNSAMMNYIQAKRTEKSSFTRKAGEAYLEENKKKAGVVTLPSGLQYTVLKEGTGPKPTIKDTVKVHYHGTLIDGTVFDSSIQRGEPIEFPVGNVIPGWVEALQLMPVGSKWRLFIPANLAYGDNDMGQQIKGGSALIFDVELLDIVKK